MGNSILVTGGAGYIGSHCVLMLMEKGYDVIVFDNLSTGHLETIERLKEIGNIEFIQGDLTNFEEINNVFKNNKFAAVMHFAAFSQVGESVKNPHKIDQTKCIKCEACLNSCPFKAIGKD